MNYIYSIIYDLSLEQGGNMTCNMNLPVLICIFMVLFSGLSSDIYADSVVTFNEIMYHPEDSQADSEWIELYNQMAVDIDLSGWAIKGAVKYTFPEGTFISGGSYIVVAKLPDELISLAGTENVFGPFDGQLSNSGESLRLETGSGRVMDSITYNDKGSWPIGPDGSGVSLSKKNKNQASLYSQNWTHSHQVGGTPGAENFPVKDLRQNRVELVGKNDVWKYWDWGIDLGTEWKVSGYDTTYWRQGAAGFVFGYNVETGEMEPVTTLFSTGLDDDGFPLTTGSYDLHYEFTATGEPVYAMINHSAWLANDSSSQWIGFSSSGTDSQPVGLFPISTTFDLDGWDHETVGITMYIAVDNAVGDVLINGISTGITCNVYDSWCGPFVIDSGFVAGRNELTFNFINEGDSINPAGLRVWMEAEAMTSLGNTELTSCPQTCYFRKNFLYDPTDETTVGLSLDFTVDDGAVFYLNGQEIYRYNMPDGAVEYSTYAETDIVEILSNGEIQVPAEALVAGENIFAIEVHNVAAGESDFYFQAELTAIETPIDTAETVNLVFNELSASEAGPFWVEMVNYGNETLDLTGVVIHLDGQVDQEYVLPSGVLGAGDYIVLDETVLGFSPEVDDKMYLYWAGKQLLMDAAIVKDVLQGRETPDSDYFSYPQICTPGEDNIIGTNNDIVINEIMYHKGDIFASPGVYETVVLVSKGHQAKVLVPSASQVDTWTGADEPFDDSLWQDGYLGVGYDNEGDYNSDIGIDIHDDIYNQCQTFYVRTEFELTNTTTVGSMTLRMKYDDGFIVYLNGIKIAEVNAPDDPDWTSSSTGSHEASEYETFDVSDYVEALKNGSNILAIQGFNYGVTSSDLLVLPELSIVDEIVAPIEADESSEEWVELYNRGADTVNLEGWELDGDISYVFEAATLLNAGDYLVVARDREALLTDWPEINIVGDFDGRLSNSIGSVILRDPHDNIADEVKYYDGAPWPEDADGYNASLELCNPFADNNSALSWSASNEQDKSSWQTYTYRGIASPSIISQPDSQWREFVLGMLDAGVLLIDDISVVEDPDGTAIQLLQNGTFEDTPGENSWRLLGTHRHSSVVIDPYDSANHVLKLVSTGTTDHMHNHIEITLANGKSVTNGQTYEISFRARWVSGSNQLNTRLYFNRLANTTLVEKPRLNGTPGTLNSQYVVNPGPVFSNFSHFPAVPRFDEDITISAKISDPSGIAGAIMEWRIDGNTWNSISMTTNGDSLYSAVIPKQASGSIVQFYIRASDLQGAISEYPVGGPDSRALFRVDDGLASENGLHNMRILTTSDDNSWLHTDINVMSNDRIAATVIYDEEEIFYNVGIRLKGSQHHRTPSNEVGFNVQFHADQLFRGVHKTVAIDRSQGVGFGQRELLINQAMNHSNAVASKYTDLIKLMPNLAVHTSTAELQLARFNDEFLDGQFENGSDGNLYEYELVYYPLATNNGDEEGYKIPLPDNPVGVGIYDLGVDKEAYRWLYLGKNNRAWDSYDTLMDFCKFFGDSSNVYYEQLDSVIDIDIWLESFAIAVASGSGDNYGGDNAAHNAMIYVRPEDGRVLYFPHDLDYAYETTRSIVPNSDLNKMIANPNLERLYYGYLYHILNSSYNVTYMSHWTDHFGELLVGQNFDSYLTFIGERYNYLSGELNARIAADYGFVITDLDKVVDSDSTTIEGKAWINVKSIRLVGMDGDLDISWSKTGSGSSSEFHWQANVPLEPGVNNLVFEATGFNDELIGQASIIVTSTLEDRPLREFFKISEIMYDPQGGTDYEFIEVTNTGPESLDLTYVSFNDGIDFAFLNSNVNSIDPGEYVVIVKDISAFTSRYGSSGIVVAGEYSGKLSNDGEKLSIIGQWNAELGTVTYNNGRGWPLAASGAGHSIVRDNSFDGSDDYGMNWRASTYMNGSPGQADVQLCQSVVINEIMAHTDYSDNDYPEYDSNDWIELFNPGSSNIVLDAGEWYLSDDEDDLKKWELPQTNISAFGYVSFDEVTGFNNPIGTGFGLNKSGEKLYLSYLPGNNMDRIVDCVSFKGQENDISLARLPDAGVFWQAAVPTRDYQNQVGLPHAVISELMYDPIVDNYEFVELYNPTNDTISLWDDETNSGWRLDGGISYDFSTNSEIPPYGYLLILPFDPTGLEYEDFLVQYGISPAVLEGPYSGKLSNDGERVALEKPEAADDGTDDNSWVIVDEVIYSDMVPWPGGIAETGLSLWRFDNSTSGNNPDSWNIALASPGAAVCDFNADGVVNIVDWSLMADNWFVSSTEQNTPFTGDVINTDSGIVDFADLAVLVDMWLKGN